MLPDGAQQFDSLRSGALVQVLSSFSQRRRALFFYQSQQCREVRQKMSEIVLRDGTDLFLQISLEAGDRLVKREQLSGRGMLLGEFAGSFDTSVPQRRLYCHYSPGLPTCGP